MNSGLQGRMSDLVEVCNEDKMDYSTQVDNGQGIPCADDGPPDAVVTNSNSVKDGQLAISSVEKVKDPEHRRSKSGRRRSGFSRGRVSLTKLSRESSAADTDTVGSELYKQIPVEMSPAERLSLLSRLQLRCTLEILDKQFEDVPGFENFKAEALESVGALVDQMERDGTFHQACTTPSLAPNPVNLQMDSTICALSSCIKRLEKEDADWNELVSTLETQAGNAEQQLSQLEVEHRDLPEDVKQLSLSFLPQPSDVPDLAAICTDTVRDVKTISLLMEDYSHSVDLLNIVHEAASRHMDRVTTTLGEAYSCHQRDPKESIQHLLAS